MFWSRRVDEVREEIRLAADIAEEIAGQAVEEAAQDTDPDEVRIVYPDGRTAKVSKQVAKELIARGRAELL